MKQRQLFSITLGLNITTTLAALTAWIQTTGNYTNPIKIAGLLALIAFSLMWVHYVTDYAKQTIYPKQDTGNQYNVTRWVVLSAILLHPVLINFYLYQKNYGLPPASYESYLGAAEAPFVFLGTLALVVFLAYELKKWFTRKGVWNYVWHANHVAMILVLIHGFHIGTVINSGWYVWLWMVYAVVLLLLIVRQYVLRYQDNPQRRVISMIVIALFAIAVVNAGAMALGDQISAPSSQDIVSKSQDKGIDAAAITLVQLAEHNGVDGQSCWVAIDGTVYDASDNPEWQNGEHVPSNGMAKCGEDLSDVIGQSPHGKSVLSQLMEVGTLTN